MASTHIDYRKIDYDQLIDKPITRVASSVNPNTLTTAGVYDRGDGNRFIVTVDGQNITQVIEEKDGYQTRSSTDGGTTWTTWNEVEFSKSGDIDAEDVNYDNTTSGLTATNVQGAIDEIDTSVDTINTTITNIQTDITEIKDIVEVETMPSPSEESEGTIIQYKGATTSTFTHGYFYECVGDGQDPETFSWVNIQVQDNPSQAEVMPTPSAENVGQIIQYAGDTNNYYTHAHFYEVIEDPENPGQYIYKEVEVQDSPAQSEDMPEADEDSVGKIIQYIGETDANFTHGYFYECVSDGENPATYSWVRIDVQPSEVGDSHEFISLTAYNQLTPEQKAEKVYMITEDGVAPTPTPTPTTPGLYGYAVPFHNAIVKYSQLPNTIGGFYDESNSSQKEYFKQYYNANSYVEFEDAISRHYKTDLASNITNITSGKITYGYTTPSFSAEIVSDNEYLLDQDLKIVSVTEKEERDGGATYGVIVSRFTDPADNKIKSFSFVGNTLESLTIGVNTWTGDVITSTENIQISLGRDVDRVQGSGWIRSYKNFVRGGIDASRSGHRTNFLLKYEGGTFSTIVNSTGYANGMDLIAIDEDNGYMYFYYYNGNHDKMSRFDINNEQYADRRDRTSGTGNNQRMSGPTVVNTIDGKAVMFYTYGSKVNVKKEIDLINKTVSETDKEITYNVRADYKTLYEKLYDQKGGNPTGLSILETDGVTSLNKIQYTGNMSHVNEIISGECYNIKVNGISVKSENWYEVLGNTHALYNNAKYGEPYAITNNTLDTTGLSKTGDVSFSNLSTDKNYLDIQFDVNQNGTGPSGTYSISIVGMSDSQGTNNRTTFDIEF